MPQGDLSPCTVNCYMCRVPIGDLHLLWTDTRRISTGDLHLLWADTCRISTGDLHLLWTDTCCISPVVAVGAITFYRLLLLWEPSPSTEVVAVGAITFYSLLLPGESSPLVTCCCCGSRHLLQPVVAV